MPVFVLECPDCGHCFQGLVLAGTRAPEVWVCSKCRGRNAAPKEGVAPRPHPWEGSDHGRGCPCCL
jgi:rubrerythrin